jgi:hypothetical protein
MRRAQYIVSWKSGNYKDRHGLGETAITLGMESARRRWINEAQRIFDEIQIFFEKKKKKKEKWYSRGEKEGVERMDSPTATSVYLTRELSPKFHAIPLRAQGSILVNDPLTFSLLC